MYGGRAYGNEWGRAPVYPRTYGNPGGSHAKRSWEVYHRALNIQAGTGTTQSNVDVYFSSTSGGGPQQCTIKNITLDLNAGSATTQAVYWVLVYVPAGTSTLAIGTTSGGTLYAAQQFVLAQGSFIADADASPIRVFTPLARRLVSGDKIVFASIGTNAAAYQLIGTAKFALGT